MRVGGVSGAAGSGIPAAHPVLTHATEQTRIRDKERAIMESPERLARQFACSNDFREFAESKTFCAGHFPVESAG
jgi:hypothetical protein